MEQLLSPYFSRTAWKCLQIINTLPNESDDYINDFIFDKVYITANSYSQIYHTGALVSFYRNYLIDKQRALKNVFDPIYFSDQDGNETDQAQQYQDQKSFDDFIANHDEKDQELLLNLLELEVKTGRIAPDLVQAFHKNLAIDLDQITIAAQDFLQAKKQWKKLNKHLWWIHLYLTKHFCATGDDYSSLFELSKCYPMPSYYSRIVNFGLHVPKHNDAAMRSFHSSYCGEWLTSLGITIDAEHRFEIRIALKILCLVALHQQAMV
ncbi:hypothetical protein [Chromatium okenii]|uniref:Uncharacterized protein n=1 Tax=Chromatium okenii TaxID=61644 RepID=A0A2S7XU88_9GAMM|nr:hypothetical protein [Chromatium okenii]PQJ97058.1 hypothetical protein CXB77_03475 [Chromatium okenii]